MPRMAYLKSTLIVLILLVGMSVKADEAAQEVAHPSRCEIGTYRLSDGTMLDIGPGAEGRLRWRLLDGRSGELEPQKNGRWVSTLGWTRRPDGNVVTISDCRSGKIRFDDLPGHRQPIIQVDTRFQGSGAVLAGRLTLPAGSDRVPIVVLIHGAEHFSALENYSLQRQFASAGIGVFAYDKRGTGSSGGRYTQNYLILATDAVLAMREARRLAGARGGRVGYQGGSQGGWVAPLAARIEPVDFVIVSFGLAVSVLDEDREAIELDMDLGGFDPRIKQKAMEVADATMTIVASNFTAGYEQLELVKRNYGEEPWFKAIRGNFSKYLLDTPAEISRKEGAILLEGVPAQYDPMPVLSNLGTPQLWLLGGQDRDAPSAETARRLTALRKEGRPITLIVFPNAEHGMYEFESLENGERVSTRQPQGYFDAMRDFIKTGN